MLLRFAGASQAGKSNYTFSFEVNEQVLYDQNAIDQSAEVELDAFSRPHNIRSIYSLDEIYNILSVSPSLSIYPHSPLSAALTIDFAFISQESAPHNDTDIQIYEAYVRYRNTPYLCQLGVQPTQYGNGLLYDGFEPAGVLQVNWGDSYFKVNGALIDEISPMGEVLCGMRTRSFGKFEIFATAFKDQDNQIAEAFESEINLLVDIILKNANITHDISQMNIGLSDAAQLYWFGLTLETLVGDIFLSGNFIFETGNIDFTLEAPMGQTIKDRVISRNISSWFGNVQVEYNFTSRVSGGLFLYISQGDANYYQDDLRFFIPVRRYIPYATIFFGNGYWPFFSDDLLFQRDPPDGVFAPGFTLDYRPRSTVSLSMNGTIFYPQAKPSDDRTFYGWEYDLSAAYEVRPDITLTLSTAYFKHGDWFKEPLDDILTIGLGINYFYSF